MSAEDVKQLKLWVQSFAAKENRKPQAADMPEHIRELST